MSTLGGNSSAEGWLVYRGMVHRWPGHAHATIRQALGQVSFATRGHGSVRPWVDQVGNLSVLFEGNLYNSEKLRLSLTSKQKSAIGSIAEEVAHLLAESYQGNLVNALKKISPVLDGEFCLAASDGKQVVLMRDFAGLRPAFYAENDQLFAFASRKTALWDIGLRNVRPLRAGMIASFGKDGVIIDEACPLSKMNIQVTVTDPVEIIDSYCALLKASVEKRLKNVKRVAALVSGGVDSCLVAKLVSDMSATRGIELTAYTAGVGGATDIEYAERFAQELGLKHKVRILSQDEIESYIARVAAATEERDLVQIEAGIGVYAAVEMASQDSYRVIFSGQGPDELWGGYSWYPQVIAEDGYDCLSQNMWGDLERADIETFDRENRIAMEHGVEKVFPYVDIQVVKLAMSVSPQLKITSAEDRIGKRPHREAAKRLGLPAEYADRSKDAAQHGTGIHDTLDAIARKNGFTPELVERVGYDSDEVSQEKLASSTRYGYLYAEKALWQTPQHVQFFVDSVAYRNDLLNEAERSRIKRFLNKAGI
ncbi:MAG: asparagine synthetase B [Chloroflexota bacterium]|nr:MAG: asparagine synthetase B [Chloroflexota bacterium]